MMYCQLESLKSLYIYGLRITENKKEYQIFFLQKIVFLGSFDHIQSFQCSNSQNIKGHAQFYLHPIVYFPLNAIDFSIRNANNKPYTNTYVCIITKQKIVRYLTAWHKHDNKAHMTWHMATEIYTVNEYLVQKSVLYALCGFLTAAQFYDIIQCRNRHQRFIMLIECTIQLNILQL